MQLAIPTRGHLARWPPRRPIFRSVPRTKNAFSLPLPFPPSRLPADSPVRLLAAVFDARGDGAERRSPNLGFFGGEVLHQRGVRFLAGGQVVDHALVGRV